MSFTDLFGLDSSRESLDLANSSTNGLYSPTNSQAGNGDQTLDQSLNEIPELRNPSTYHMDCMDEPRYCYICALECDGKYSLQRKSDNLVYYICNDDCLKIFEKEYSEKYIFVYKSTNLENQKCSVCDEKIINQDMLSWNMMDFCNEICLSKYQKDVGSICASCKSEICSNFFGEYVGRFGNKIKHFCSSDCVKNYEMSVNPCSFCQCNILSEFGAFLAFVGDKDECNEFCSERCLYKYERVIYKKPQIYEDKSKRKCSTCDIENSPTIDYDWNGITIYFCSETCFKVFKTLSDIEPRRCSLCQQYFPVEVLESSSVFYDHVEYSFCSNICQRLYMAANRKIVSCVWCKTDKYNFDMIRLSKDDATSDLCSLNCLKLFQAFTFETKVCHFCSKHLQETYDVIRIDAINHNLCSLNCVVSFKARHQRVDNDKQHQQHVFVNPIRSEKCIKTEIVDLRDSFGDDTGQQVSKPTKEMEKAIDVEAIVMSDEEEFNPNHVKEKRKRCKQNGKIEEANDVETILMIDEESNPNQVKENRKRSKTDDEIEEANDVETILMIDEESNPNQVKENRKRSKRDDEIEEAIDVETILMIDEESNPNQVKANKKRSKRDDEIEEAIDVETILMIDEESNPNHIKEEMKRHEQDEGLRKKHLPELSQPGLNLKLSIGVNAWKTWVATHNEKLEKPIKTEILDLTPKELNYSLCLFVKEMKKSNGTEYSPDTFYYFCLGIQLYLFKHDRPVNIFWDPAFKQFTETINELAKKFCMLYNDSRYITTRIEEEHLWESKLLGTHSPHAILNTLVYFNTKYNKLTTVQEHMRLSFAHTHPIRCYNEKDYKNGFSAKLIYTFPAPKRGNLVQEENNKNPLRCPVKLYGFYLSKCPACVKTRNDIFYLQPETCYVAESPIWYSPTKLSEQELEIMLYHITMVKEICTSILSN